MISVAEEAILAAEVAGMIARIAIEESTCVLRERDSVRK